MNETNSTVSSQTVASAPLDVASSEASPAPSSSMAESAPPVVVDSTPPVSESNITSESVSTSLSLSDLSQSLASSTSTSEVVGLYDNDRFLTKPINDYTPTEGYLLLLFCLVCVALVFALFKR